MSFDAFLKIATIEGESTDDAHQNWIEVLSYDHMVTQPTSGSGSTSGGRTSGRCDHGNFNITKMVDKATPKLFLACCNGEHIPEIKLEVCRSSKDKIKYYEVVLRNCIVSSVTCNGQSKGATAAPLPTESVSFAYIQIEWTYTETDKETGSAKGTVPTKWDIEKNIGG